jgi:hypothetical protein
VNKVHFFELPNIKIIWGNKERTIAHVKSKTSNPEGINVNGEMTLLDVFGCYEDTLTKYPDLGWRITERKWSDSHKRGGFHLLPPGFGLEQKD